VATENAGGQQQAEEQQFVEMQGPGRQEIHIV
jgi:hypothetical protein